VENNNNMQLDFNDLVLVQKPVGLNSRSEVNLEYFPIFNAPMDTVLSKDNAQVFKNAGINLCLPRNAGVEVNEEDFISVGLVEFEEMIKSIDLNHKKKFVLMLQTVICLHYITLSVMQNQNTQM